ncbi:MAG: universal stress protein [Lentisphaeria bacterium]|jgi:nucleotide-binding universal stress UspA family protein
MTAKNTEIKRVLFCTDFSANAHHAFDFAVDTAAKREGCELILLHVIPEPDAQFWKAYIYELDTDVDKNAREALDAKIDSEYRPRVPAGVPFRAEFRIGKDYAKIIDVAREFSVDLIVLGRQGRGALQSIFFGTVAEKVVKRSTCPVLVIPLPRNDSVSPGAE